MVKKPFEIKQLIQKNCCLYIQSTSNEAVKLKILNVQAGFKPASTGSKPKLQTINYKPIIP
jgi:hypothetical protein